VRGWCCLAIMFGLSFAADRFLPPPWENLALGLLVAVVSQAIGWAFEDDILRRERASRGSA